THVAAVTNADLSQESATQTNSAIITENSDGLYKLEDKLSADELYQRALIILRTLKPLPKKRFEIDDSDPSLFLLSYRFLAKCIFSVFGLRSPIADSEIGRKVIADYRHPKLVRAFELLEKAAFEYNHDGALFTLGELNFHAKYTHPRNLTAALYYYRELANRSGNATAQQMVGFMYATGIGNIVMRDQGKALLYHTFAALGHDTAAEMTLGYRYLMGIGVHRSCEDAVFYYKRVADKAIEHYKSGPPGGRQLPSPLLKSRLYDEDGGVYGYGASGPGAGYSSKPDQAVWDDILEFYHYSAENGDMTAQLGLGQLYYQGTRNINQNFPRAYKFLKDVANSYWPSESTFDDPPNMTPKQRLAAGQAAGILGRMYWRGEGVEPNNKTALKWFIRGVRLDDPVAWNGLGMMYMEGVEVIRNYDQAIHLFKLAAEKEYSEAQVNLGLIYLHQKGDYPTAFEFFRLAANQDHHILAHYYLAEMYTQGLGTEKSCAVAAAFYKNVAERGDWLHSPFPAAYRAYHIGDRDTALINHLLAAERGYELGQANAAWLLDQDKSRWHPPHLVPKVDTFREKLALIYWTRSANQGNVDSRVKMGDYYFKGFGTEVNYVKAAACYQVAAEAESSAMAMWNLGWMHENGIGVARDFHLAKRWYDQSLSTNPDAYLPVKLSLTKLYAKSFWNFISRKEIVDDADESSRMLWWGDPSSNGEDEEAGGAVEQVRTMTKEGANLKERKEWDAVGPDGEQLIKSYNARKKGVDDFTDSSSNLEDEYDDEEYGREDLIESLMILALCLLVGYLVYLRQLRWNQAENNRIAGGENGADQANNANNAARFGWAGAGGD
ncbi:7042_t:CDS:10, partial [Funneliformis caledonium]